MSARRIAFLHAFPCVGQMWEPQVAAVEAVGWRALAPDLAGFGSVPLPESAPSLDVVADRVMAELTSVHEGSWAIAGVSLGGYVAMNLLRRYPDRMEAVLLCDTKATADGVEAQTNRERLATLCEAPGADVGRILEQAVLPGLVGPTTHQARPDVVDRVRGWLAQADGRSVAWYQRAMAARPDSVGILREFERPALVVWGEEDVLSPLAEQAVMIEALRQGREVRVAGAGHLANVERPDVVSAAVVDFLTMLEQRS